MALDVNEVGRWLFGASLLLSWANSAIHVLTSDRPLYAKGVKVLAGARPGARKALVVGALTAVFFAAAVAFLLRWHELVAGVAVLAVMLVVRRLEIREWNREIVVGLGKYVPSAAALLAYLCAWIVADRWTAVPPERAGWEAACGVLAGAYVLAALAKFRLTGTSWVRGRTVSLLVAERSFVRPRWLRRLRYGVASRPGLSWFVAFYGMAIEVGAVVYVLPAARWPFTIAATLMQLGIAIFLGYYEIEWIAVMLALTLASVGV